MTTERKQFNGEAPTAEAGRQLFLDGGTIENAQRFKDLSRRQGDFDQVAYFTWEIDSLFLFVDAMPLPPFGDPIVCEARRFILGRSRPCFGAIGEMGDGRRKCVSCGAS